MDVRPIATPPGARRRSRYSARPFAITVLVLSFITILAYAKSGLASSHYRAEAAVSVKRQLSTKDAACRLVHHASDKCAFVQANCPDEEAGVFSYLSLYYCHLHHVKPVAFAILVTWLALLFSTIGIAASDFFCVNLSTIASSLGMSESMAGVTFLAFGNGSPDVFSTFAAFNTNSASLAIGELIGAACFISAVVAGSMALVRPFNVARRSFVRDVGFFIFAASFSLVFLWDGKLTLWESSTMVGFYIFYVCFVMVWYWWLGRRKARRMRTAMMRSQFVMPGGEEEEIPQEYHDDDDAPASQGRPTPLRVVSVDDFSALERAGSDAPMEADDNEEMRERWLGELNNNMRLSRPKLSSRRNTHTPIRPSLVGALEFRAVLSSLQKSRNIQSMPIGLRRYSDDPTYTTAQQQDHISSPSDPAPRPPYEVGPESSSNIPIVTRPTSDIQDRLATRARAVSTNDIDNMQLDHDTWNSNSIPTIDFAPATPQVTRDYEPISSQPPLSPTISVSPPPSERPSRATSPASTLVRHTSNRLAPPNLDGPVRQGSTGPSPRSSPIIDPWAPSAARSPSKLVVPGPSSPTIPFPAYTDLPSPAHSSRAPSLRLPSPSASPESFFHGDSLFERSDRPKIPRWWPSKLLPRPDVLVATLFPTMTNWRDKNIWEKMLGIVAAPSVFLLTITLPVVESEKDDSEDDPLSGSFSLPGPLTPTNGSLGPQQRVASTVLIPESPLSDASKSNTTPSSPREVGNSIDAAPAQRTHSVAITSANNIIQSPEQLPTDPAATDEKSWNRWLVILQMFTAPFFVVFIVWANTNLEHPRALVKPAMYSLLFSLCMLGLVLVTTTPDRPPRWRTLLCFMGFAVSIAWISSIANEVVGVLKTLGVILNMSDAILGLTIFAVGNSLGDFVADVTVARLGFPVMALSACFGGPMLNILLGIGISGCYIIMKGGQHHHKKHPDRPIHFKPYQIDVSTTLVISGATLLVTLVGLLVAVPWRKWKMDKTVGLGLVALWTLSTVANVVVEVIGFSSNVT